MTRFKRPLANEIIFVQQGLYDGSYNEFLHSEGKICIIFALSHHS